MYKLVLSVFDKLCRWSIPVDLWKEEASDGLRRAKLVNAFTLAMLSHGPLFATLYWVALHNKIISLAVWVSVVTVS